VKYRVGKRTGQNRELREKGRPWGLGLPVLRVSAGGERRGGEKSKGGKTISEGVGGQPAVYVVWGASLDSNNT